MKSLILFSAAASMVAFNLAHASLIAGWDFSQFSSEAYDDIDETFEGRNSLYANYSDLGALPFGLDSQAFGIATWNNPNAGNFDVTMGSWTPNLIASQGIQAISDRLLSFDSVPAGPTWGQIYQNHFKFGNVYGNPDSVTFQASAGTAIDTLGLHYGANTWDGGAGSVSISYSIDGGSTFSTPFVQNITAADAVFSMDYSSIGTVASGDFWVKFDLTGNATIDNVAILGSVVAVPEPSSVWFLGALSLGMVAFYRRRR